MSYTSKIKLYTGLGYGPAKNFVIEDLLAYLADFAPIYQDDEFQWIRPSLTQSVRVPLSQSVINANGQPQLAVIEEEGLTYFYFVSNVEQTSRDTVTLSLTLDVLNTFSPSFSERTHITRRHKSRFVVNSAEDKCALFVDPYPEGIQVDKFRTASVPVVSSAGKWYLRYRGEPNNADAIDVAVLPEMPISIAGSNPNGFTIDSDFMGAHTYFYIYGKENEGAKVQGSTAIGDALPNGNTLLALRFSKAVGGGLVGVGVYYEPSPSAIGGKGFKYGGVAYGGTTVIVDGSVGGFSEVDYSLDENGPRIEFDLNQTIDISTSGALSPFSNLDLTDEKLVKVIELPYAPFTPTFTLTQMDLPNGFTQTGGMLHCSAHKDFGNLIVNQSNLASICVPPSVPERATPRTRLSWGHAMLVEGGINPDPRDEREFADPKLLHSDFTTIKAVFDSFAIPFAPQDFIAPSGVDGDLLMNCEFKPTNTINSKFLFAFDFFADPQKEPWTVQHVEDFGYNLLVTRNSEVPIFTSAYLEYIRNGFNYDKKVASQNNAVNWLTAALSIGGAVASAATGNAFGATAAISLGVSAASRIVSNTMQQVQTQQSIAQKLVELRAQSTSVSGTDDLDLFNYYGKNQLFFLCYEPKGEVYDLLDDLFYYFGYACNEYGAPTHDNRHHFDYVQCEAVFDEDGKESPEVLDSLRSKFLEGVTYIHHTAEGWDIQQTMENWENEML